MKATPEFKKSPYWDFHNDKVKPGTPPEIKADLENAFQNYLAEGKKEAKAWLDAAQASIDAHKK